MDKLKRFIECHIPTEACNLRCSYCYITQHKKFNNQIAKFERPPSYIKKALSVDRLGGTCLFNICADGETLLSAGLIDVIEAILSEGHYVMVVTNGLLTNRLEAISGFDTILLRRLFFKFSFHYLELKKHDLFNKFFSNVKLIQNRGCSFSVELTPCDEMIPCIDDIKKICVANLGALCHVTVARNELTNDLHILSEHSFGDYQNIWSVFDSKLFSFKARIFNKKRREYCYAGDWSIVLDLVSGEVTQCYAGNSLGNIYTNINEPIHFRPVGNNCAQPHCYNGHAFLTLGTIPVLKTPNYNEMRDRTNIQGISWLQPEMKNFMNQKLKDNNAEIAWWKKLHTITQGKIKSIISYASRLIKNGRLSINNKLN